MWSVPPARILVPIDFGEASGRAVDVGHLLAEAYQAELTVLHAETLEAPLYFTRSQVRALEHQRSAARSEAERFLRAFVERRGVKGANVALAQDAAPVAIREASRRADLLVMGTHGRRGPSRWWAGSVAERVVRDLDLPVMVVKAETHATPAMFGRMAIVAGGAAYELSARHYAERLASTFHGSVMEGTIDPGSARGSADATLLVFAREAAGALHGFTPAAVQLLRTCGRPVLFVPLI